MSSASVDVFERLELAIAEWSAEVRSSSAGVALQIARAKDRLGESQERTDSVERAALSLESVKEETARLETVLHECLGVARDASERGAAVELALAETREVLDSLRNDFSQAMAERPYTAGAVRDETLAAEVEALRAEVNRVRDSAAGDEVNSLRNEMSQLRSELSEVRESASRVAELEGMLAVERERADRLEGAFRDLQPAGDASAASFPASDELAALRSELDEMREAVRMPSPPAGYREEMDGVQRLLEELREAGERMTPREELGQAIETLRYELSELRETAYAPHGGYDEALDALREEVRELRSGLRAPHTMAPETGEPALREMHHAHAAYRRREDLELSGFDADGRRRRMGDILVDAGVITREQLEEALQLQQEQPQRRLGAILVEMGQTESDVIAQVLACQLKLPFVRLEDQVPEEAAVRLVSGRLASHHRCIPIRIGEDTVVVAMANPLDLIAIEDMELSTGRRVDPVVAAEADIAKAIEWFYSNDH